MDNNELFFKVMEDGTTNLTEEELEMFPEFRDGFLYFFEVISKCQAGETPTKEEIDHSREFFTSVIQTISMLQEAFEEAIKDFV